MASSRPRLDTAQARDHPSFMDGTQACATVTNADTFYPEARGSSRAAIRVCNLCPLTAACLEWALDTRQAFGVWGGKTPRERINIRKRRAAP